MSDKQRTGKGLPSRKQERSRAELRSPPRSLGEREPPREAAPRPPNEAEGRARAGLLKLRGNARHCTARRGREAPVARRAGGLGALRASAQIAAQRTAA